MRTDQDEALPRTGLRENPKSPERLISSAYNLRTALVHEWISARAGSEQTFEQMARCIPNADLYALTHEPAIEMDTGGRPISTTPLQHAALRNRRALTLPLMPVAWRSLKTPVYDMVITSSHAFARYFPAPEEAMQLSYVYAPMRYAWSPEIDGRGSHPAFLPARWALRKLDRRTTNDVDHFAAISTEVARRIRDAYRREASVIFPPVNTQKYTLDPGVARRGFLLGVSRWVPYKRLESVIRVGEQVRMPVVLAGSGPDATRLRRVGGRATVPVEIIEAPSDSELRDLYRSCEILIFPALEDFGIVPVEAQACGTKVVAYGRGGSADTVVNGETGILSPSQEVHDLVRATRECLRLGNCERKCTENASRFSVDEFATSFSAWVENALRDGPARLKSHPTVLSN